MVSEVHASLDELRAQLAEQQQAIERLQRDRGRFHRPSTARRMGGRSKAGLAVALIALLAMAPALALAATFSDVPPSNPFYSDVEAIAAAGVTTGCGGGNYCPTANVTREQMAAFMNRLGALGAGKTPVVNAKTSQSTDGWSIGCPSGTVWSQGLCFEKTNRASANVYTASDTCAGLSGLFFSGWRYRLPTAMELRGARNVAGIDLDASGELTDSVHYTGSAYDYIAVLDGGGVVAHSTLDLLKFRCVTPPLSVDFNLIVFSEQNRYPAAAPASQGAVGPDGAPLN